jgi:hypothetical protein
MVKDPVCGRELNEDLVKAAPIISVPFTAKKNLTGTRPATPFKRIRRLL